MTLRVSGFVVLAAAAVVAALAGPDSGALSRIPMLWLCAVLALIWFLATARPKAHTDPSEGAARGALPDIAAGRDDAVGPGLGAAPPVAATLDPPRRPVDPWLSWAEDQFAQQDRNRGAD